MPFARKSVEQQRIPALLLTRIGVSSKCLGTWCWVLTNSAIPISFRASRWVDVLLNLSRLFYFVVFLLFSLQCPFSSTPILFSSLEKSKQGISSDDLMTISSLQMIVDEYKGITPFPDDPMEQLHMVHTHTHTHHFVLRTQTTNI